MKVFAIDPGNTQSAYCVMTDDFQLLEFAKLPNTECMAKMLEWLDKIESVVIERVASYGLAVGKEVFETCEWIGRFTQEASHVVNIEYVFRKDEKIYLCNDMRAKDSNIRQALIDRFAKFDFKSGRGTKANPDYFYGVKADCWAAIAVATTFYDMRINEKLKEEKHV